MSDFAELGKVRQCVEYCFRYTRASQSTVYKVEPGTREAVVIKSRFLLFSNGVAISSANNEQRDSSGKLHFSEQEGGGERAKPTERQVRTLLIRVLNYIRRCVCSSQE